ncbi:GGDEF domain-containing protein, partial [Candidatus Woesearchaeota archaeon]|nr:GGDEF domain-containing protein [Candidatus Woesearchaeota archaeon]
FMTKLKNRISFDDDSKRVVREGIRFSLIILDIDHFKNFNDKYGHAIGDEVLIAVASAIKSAAKKSSDMVYRFGGEEISVILPKTELGGANTVAEEMRRKVEKTKVIHAGKVLKVTVSAGVIALEDYKSARERGLDNELIRKKVIKQADINLYRAKKAGRNNVKSSKFSPSANEDEVMMRLRE